MVPCKAGIREKSQLNRITEPRSHSYRNLVPCEPGVLTVRLPASSLADKVSMGRVGKKASRGPAHSFRLDASPRPT
jgi:hypothetical protein